MKSASPWNEATPDSEFARALPPKPFEGWIVAGFWLLVVAALAARLALPAPYAETPTPATQTTTR